MNQYQVTGYHRHGWVAEYPLANSEQEARQKCLRQLREMAKPFKIHRVETKVYMTEEELKQFGGAL
jgi:hypothetical protein